MPAVLAVDLGKTSCRAALWLDDGPTPAAQAEAAGAPGLAEPDGVGLAERSIASVHRQIRQGIDVPDDLLVGIGAAGALAAPDTCPDLAGRLSALIPTGVFAICSDAVIAHAGALDGRPGLVLTLGTGATVIGIAPSGPGESLVQVDGWGPLLGDLGSGGWIGAAGLRAALRSFDGRGPATALQSAAEVRYGALPGLPSEFAGGDFARRAAGFAPLVAEQARAGDRVSSRILAAAADHLAESARAGQHRLAANTGQSGWPLAIVGGLLELGPVLLDPLRAAIGRLAPELQIEPAAGTALDGARRLALDTTTPHEPLVYRTAAPSAPDRAASPARATR